MDQTAKRDAGKPRPTLVPVETIKALTDIEEFEYSQKKREIPKLISAQKNGKGVFECPYCGKHFEAYIANIRRGRQHSCGCMKGKFMVESKGTHGATKTRLYRIYRHIKERCESPSCKEYKWYGARGIQCKFDTFEDFRDYAYQNGYTDELTCERIDVNGNYEPGNVTFIPLQLQARNTRSNVNITYKGLTLCAAEWAEIMGVNADTLTKRKRSGWEDKRIIETKVHKDDADMSLVPIEAIRAIRETRMFGVKKYSDPDNWKKVEPQRYRDAAYRHWLAYLENVDSIDEESGLPSLWHLLTDIGFLVVLEWGRHVKSMLRRSETAQGGPTAKGTVLGNETALPSHKTALNGLGGENHES